MIELVHEHTYTRQQITLVKKFPRLQEVTDCAEWDIQEDYTRFNLIYSDQLVKIYVWRSDDSETPPVPTVEVAYYYSIDDGLIHLLGVRIVADDEL